MRRRLIYALSLCFLVSCTKQMEQENITILTSPDGTIISHITTNSAGEIFYDVILDKKTILLPSRLGFEMRGSIKAEKLDIQKDGNITKSDNKPSYSLYDGFEVIRVDTSSFDEIWTPVWGEESSIRNHYNEVLVHLKKENRLMDIRFRLFDDGLGFRYEFPCCEADQYLCVKEELTQFNMAGDYTVWWIPGDFDTQEYEYTKSRLSEIAENYSSTLRGNSSQTPFSNKGVQTSLQMKSDSGIYVNIHEAALVDFPCMHLLVDCKNHSMRSYLTPDAQGYKGRIQTPFHTPWRTVQVVRSATDQLASRLILNLNEPCALDDVSWIHPVKYMGVWWEMIAGYGSWHYTDDFNSVKLGETDYEKAKPNGRHSANNARVREYIDFASSHGFDALLVEGWNIGWEDWANCNKDYVFDFQTPYPDFDIAALNDYAHSKGIKLVMHHETSSSPRNYERHLEAAYELMNKYGYNVVKSGYVGDILPEGMHHYSQYMVNHYMYCLKEAAKHHIMVNAHEAVRPTGVCRTYPNLIGNESAMGNEYQAFGGIKPGHTAMLPFSRLNGGPMDYTPGIFETDLKSWCGNNSTFGSTLVGQLALYVTMYSPLQMAADTPEHYSKHPEAFQFIKDVPIDWSKSVYLYAEPADYVVIVRKDKQSDDWYLGAVTDEQVRNFNVKCSFLEPGAYYKASIYCDAEDADYFANPQAYYIETRVINREDSLNIRMAPGGGYTASIKKIK